jgi:Fur family iron response transcriptional regulator
MNTYVAAARPRQGTPPPGDVQRLLNDVGLRPTRQRIALASLLLRTANRRATAEILYEEAHESQCSVSRATVCNALRHFERAGLLRRITVDRSKKAWFVIANENVEICLSQIRGSNEHWNSPESELARSRLRPSKPSPLGHGRVMR